MNASVSFNPKNAISIQEAMEYLQGHLDRIQQPDQVEMSIRDILTKKSARLLKMAHANFGHRPWSLEDLARATGESINTLHGLTGPLGIMADRRSVKLFEQHGTQPTILSVTQRVCDILDQMEDPFPTGPANPLPPPSPVGSSNVSAA